MTLQPGELTFPILSRLCGPGLTVSDDEVLRTMALAARHLKIIAEPGGAVALAAALFRADEIDADTVICTVSGGNLDTQVLVRALTT
jgi:threonine dehydratase